MTGPGPTIVQYGAFRVTDDGKPGHLYGVWADVIPTLATPNVIKEIGSGFTFKHAVMVAEALHLTSAGTKTFPLIEGQTI